LTSLVKISRSITVGDLVPEMFRTTSSSE